MSHRVNIMLDETLWEQLQEIPKGERSSLINQSLAESLLKRRRLNALARLRERAEAKERLPGSAEEWVRHDRDAHA